MKGETKNGDIPCSILNHDCGRSIYFTPKFFDIRLCQALLLGASTVCLDNMVQRCEDALGDLLFCGRIPSWRKPVGLVGWWVFDGFEKRGGWWDATDISIDKTSILMASESNPLRYPLSEIWPCDHFSHYFSLNKAGQKEAPVDQSVYLSRNQIAWGVSIEFHLATVLSWSWNPRISGLKDEEEEKTEKAGLAPPVAVPSKASAVAAYWQQQAFAGAPSSSAPPPYVQVLHRLGGSYLLCGLHLHRKLDHQHQLRHISYCDMFDAERFLLGVRGIKSACCFCCLEFFWMFLLPPSLIDLIVFLFFSMENWRVILYAGLLSETNVETFVLGTKLPLVPCGKGWSSTK